MAQNWTEDVFDLSHEGETDLQNIENNFQCLKTLFSGASFGLTPAAGHPWYDTSTSILGSGLLKIRKQANDGWLGVLALAQESSNGLIWFHGNNMSNQEGWVIDVSITEDRVMALKNHGSGTYTVGRTVSGQWVINDLTIADHPQHLHELGNSSLGTAAAGLGAQSVVKGNYLGNRFLAVTTGAGALPIADWWTLGENITLSHSPVHSGAWRIRSQVGIVIYPDI